MPGHGRPTSTPRYDNATKRRLMELLGGRASRNKPVRAAPAARLLRLPGLSRETHRRRFRELVDEMRSEYTPIGSNGSGYFLATEVRDFDAAERFLRRSHARAVVAGQLDLVKVHAPIPGRDILAFYRSDETEPGRDDGGPDQGRTQQGGLSDVTPWVGTEPHDPATSRTAKSPPTRGLVFVGLQ